MAYECERQKSFKFSLVCCIGKQNQEPKCLHVYSFAKAQLLMVEELSLFFWYAHLGGASGIEFLTFKFYPSYLGTSITTQMLLFQ